MASFEKKYKDDIIPEMVDTFNYSSVMQAPRIVKIVLNMGVGEAIDNKKVINNAVSDMAMITGQKPIITLARKSVAGFKVREGWPVGCKVTLRGEIMYEFFERLVVIAIPRIRDFRGFSPKGFDSHGNYNFGVKEQIVFPELEYDKVDALRGMNITLVTSATTAEEGIALLKAFGFPLKEQKA
jgi:large subunit ribosomal protein L5